MYKSLILCLVTDNEDEAWCNTNFLNASALRLAVVIRAELLEVMQRIELPVSPPAFGCQDNITNIKRALISGFFLKVAWTEHYSKHITVLLYPLIMKPRTTFFFLPQVAHDVDGSGNYLLLTHRHVAHLHPFSSYLSRRPRPNPPNWVLYHDFTISHDNCIRTVSEVHPHMWVCSWPALLMLLLFSKVYCAPNPGPGSFPVLQSYIFFPFTETFFTSFFILLQVGGISPTVLFGEPSSQRRQRLINGDQTESVSTRRKGERRGRRRSTRTAIRRTSGPVQYRDVCAAVMHSGVQRTLLLHFETSWT